MQPRLTDRTIENLSPHNANNYLHLPRHYHVLAFTAAILGFLLFLLPLFGVITGGIAASICIALGPGIVAASIGSHFSQLYKTYHTEFNQVTTYRRAFTAGVLIIGTLLLISAGLGIFAITIAGFSISAIPATVIAGIMTATLGELAWHITTQTDDKLNDIEEYMYLPPPTVTSPTTGNRSNSEDEVLVKVRSRTILPPPRPSPKHKNDLTDTTQQERFITLPSYRKKNKTLFRLG